MKTVGSILAKYPDLKETPLFEGLRPADIAAIKNYHEILTVLGKHHTQFTLPDASSGLSAIHHAAGRNNAKSVKALVDMKVDPDLEVQDTLHTTPLAISIAQNTRAAFEALLSSGADPRKKCGLGITPLHMAASFNDADMIERLWQTDAKNDLDTQDETGKTPLHEATLSNAYAAACFLLKMGARTDIREDKQGFLAIHISEKSGFADITNLLRQYRSPLPPPGELIHPDQLQPK